MGLLERRKHANTEVVLKEIDKTIKKRLLHVTVQLNILHLLQFIERR